VTTLAHIPTDLRVDGASLVAYRLYDVGYAVRLDEALDLLASNAPERVRPVRGEAQAIQIANPPITVILGHEALLLGAGVADVAPSGPATLEVSARVFDFGAVSLRAQLAAADGTSWRDFARLGGALETSAALGPLFAHHLRLLTDRIAPAVERPAVAAQAEDFIVYRVAHLARADGTPVPPDSLGDEVVASLLLNEPRPLSPDARRELLPHRFSYYPDDLAILTWDNALIVEPRADDTDVQFLLEFANAQLLELRYYDGLLDAELPRMYDRIAALRAGGARALLRRRYAPLLGELQELVADSTELVERVENALKVTDDVYLARVYSAALEIFRARAWRSGVDRKLAIIRETYAMLNAESQAARAEALEVAIVLLIVAELAIGLLRR
jgi:hypothetical protein